MSFDDDYQRYQEEAAMEEFLEEELRRIAEVPVFDYLAVHGDAIEKRVKRCLAQAQALSSGGYHGAALTRAASGIEVTIRFFLARPLVQGAFLSKDWAALLSQKVLSGRTAEDRELLPAILRNWDIDITKVKLRHGSQAWEQIVKRVWPRRNDYVHKADDASGRGRAPCDRVPDSPTERSSRSAGSKAGLHTRGDRVLVCRRRQESTGVSQSEPPQEASSTRSVCAVRMRLTRIPSLHVWPLLHVPIFALRGLTGRESTNQIEGVC